MQEPQNNDPEISNDAVRRKRLWRRRLVSFYAIVLGIFFLFAFPDHTIHGLPAEYFFWVLIGFGVLGLVGVNVFAGGPLDKRDDTPAEDSEWQFRG